MNKKLFSVSGLVLVVVLLLAINTLANIMFKSARIDLTDNNLYTLSPGTHNIIKGIEEPITLRFYFSEKLAVGVPALMTYGRRVRDLLEEYAALSGGNLNLIVLDPEPFSDEEDQAMQYGIQGVPIDTAGSLAYFGLVGTSSTDAEQVIKFFQQSKEQTLEYDLTKLIYSLAYPGKKTVGLMSTLPLEGAPMSPFLPQSAAERGWMIVSLLEQDFKVRTVAMNADKIPDDIDTLMIVHPKNVSDKSLYAIDQFVLKGGRVIVFVDPHAESDVPPHDRENPMAAMTAPRNSNLKKIFDTWGIELVDGKIVGDIKSATRVTVGRGMRPQTVNYVAWLELGPANFNQDDFTTSELNKINMASSGILRKIDGAETEFLPLIESSEAAMQIDKNKLQFGPNPIALLNDYRKGNEKLVLAARISGKIKTAFPDGPPGDGGEKDKDDKKVKQQEKPDDLSESPLSESKESINVIVVADTDMLSDKFWVDVQNFFGQSIMVPRSNNGVFLVNVIDNLSGSNDLISLRSRGKSLRPFEKVKEIRREAEQRFREREKLLRSKLQETERKINQLQRQKQGSSVMMLSPEQKREIDNFRVEQVKTRKELRNVQHELRKNIERLGAWLKFINIGLIPILIILAAVGMEVYRLRRIKQITVQSG